MAASDIQSVESGQPAHSGQSTVLGLRHAPWIITDPRAVYSRVEDVGHYGWTLFVLLCLVTLVGVVEVQTGLIDRRVDQQTEEQLAVVEKTQGNLVDRVQLREVMADVRKQGEFMKLLRRLGAVVLKPLYMLTSFLLISSLLYAAVALTGRKPEYHTLLTICVYAGFVELIGFFLRLAMMFAYRTTHVDTNLAIMAKPGEAPYLAAIDPFRIWFWVLVAFGLIVTQQLGRRMAIVCCAILGIVASVGHVGLEYAMNS